LLSSLLELFVCLFVADVVVVRGCNNAARILIDGDGVEQDICEVVVCSCCLFNY